MTPANSSPSPAAGPREWLPFTVRLYFYAGADSIRMVHTIIFDGDDQKDFIRGLGVVFDVAISPVVVETLSSCRLCRW